MSSLICEYLEVPCLISKYLGILQIIFGIDFLLFVCMYENIYSVTLILLNVSA